MRQGKKRRRDDPKQCQRNLTPIDPILVLCARADKKATTTTTVLVYKSWTFRLQQHTHTRASGSLVIIDKLHNTHIYAV